MTGAVTDATVAVVGTGPAGDAAGRRLLSAGLGVAFLDEQPRTGGNIGRVHQSAAATALEADVAAHPAAELMAGARVLGVGADGLIRFEHRGSVRERRFAAVVLACGAYDLHHPILGCPHPGVSTAGALQALLKGQGCVPEGEVIIAGAGPFLYVVADGLVRAGARVTRVVDRLTATDYLRLAPHGITVPGNALEFAGVRWRLRRAGVGVVSGVSVTAVAPSRVSLSDGRDWPFDHLGLSELFVPQTQLARTAGCRLRYRREGGYWFVDTDDCGRTSVPGVLVCGEGQGVRGWRHARVSGELAALAVLEDRGVAVPVPRRLRRTRRRLARFGGALEARVRARDPAPVEEAVICACEGTTVGDVTASISLGLDDLSSIKVVTRCGMGPCQGRYCEPLVARCIELAGGVPRAALNQHALTRPVPAGEFARDP